MSHASLAAASSIQGQITDPSSRPVVNAAVILESDGQQIYVGEIFL
jgi:hypothetical protein